MGNRYSLTCPWLDGRHYLRLLFTGPAEPEGLAALLATVAGAAGLPAREPVREPLREGPRVSFRRFWRLALSVMSPPSLSLPFGTALALACEAVGGSIEVLTSALVTVIAVGEATCK